MAFANLPRSGRTLRRNLLPLGLASLVGAIGWLAFGTNLFGLAAQPAAPPPAPTLVQAAPPSPTPAPAPAPAPVYPSVLVASRDIASGTLIGADLIEWREWEEPLDMNLAVLEGVVSERVVTGAVTQRDFEAGELLSWDGILTPGHPGFISAVLSPGMRAVTVEVDRATTAANLIYPGDKVDVIMVTAGDATASYTIVHGSRVLAVGASVLALGRYGKPSLTEGGQIEPVPRPDGANYTLEVRPLDAERIAMATAVGQMTLAMRSINAPPGAARAAMPVRFDDLMPLPRQLPPPPHVRVLRGTEASVAGART